ncbi:MAG TPA: tetratricopeptide repeat protein [Pelomicrobium sp.]|nr:tetratricopeptide repeat protein [Pelomicrobium sp.]
MPRLLIFGIIGFLLLSPAFAAPLDDADQAYARGDFATATRLYRSLADAGNPQAQLRLGLMFHYGLGIPENDVEALNWFERAAKQGLPEAQFQLGNMYAFGFGVAPNDPAADRNAAEWYFAAARQGHAEAQYALGVLFLTGKGVQASEGEARKWMQRAAESGHADAKIFIQSSKPTK